MSSSVKKIAIKSTKLIALIFITLFTLIWLLSPYVSHHFASKYLNEQQLTLSDDTTIRYNPFGSILTIRDLSVSETKNMEKPVLAIKSMDVKVSLYRLLTDTLHFSEFTIDGLYLDVNLNEVEPVIGGFVIANNSNDPDTTEENAKEIEKSTNDSPNNYQVSLPNFILSDAIFNIGIEQSQQEFAIDSLTINNVLASSKAQQAEIDLKAFINKAPLNVDVEAKLENNYGEISSELVLSKLALAPFQPILLALGEENNPLIMEGALTINSKQVISLTDLGTKISLETFELITDAFKATQSNKTLALNITPFSIKDLSVVLNNEQPPAISGTAKLNVHDIIAYDDNESQILANISAINLDEISLSTTDSLIKANIPTIAIEQSIFAENTADEHQLTREAMDAYAIESVNRARAAIENKSLASEIAPIDIKGTMVEDDEQPGKAKLDKIPSLRPAFKSDGTITAANASSISDGASALVLTRESALAGRDPLARIVDHATHSIHPSAFTLAPIGAIEKLLAKTGWDLDSVDLFEINEAFAMVTMLTSQSLGLDPSKVNVFGGACAQGHPIGSTGSRLIVTLAHALKNQGKKRGIAALCIGGGEATAVALERN